MPSNLDDDEPEILLKFEDCLVCVNRRRPRICRGCDVGEEFQEEDPEGIDGILRF